MTSLIKEIQLLKELQFIKNINKGWSDDKKYYIETTANQKLLLRISDISKLEIKQNEFQILNTLNYLDINCSRPIDFGISNNEKYVYLIYSWIDGNDLNSEIKNKTNKEQYNLGYEAGKTLKIIHDNLPIKEELNWDSFYTKKLEKKISNYKKTGIFFDGDQVLIDYIIDNKNLLKSRPITTLHGDYHIGNMILNEQDKIGIIDFDRLDLGDPWEEFNRITWCAEKSEYFATGRIDGYFKNEVPDDFFKLLTLYISVNILSSIPWAIPFGKDEINVMINQANKMIKNYNNLHTYIPKWYKKNEFTI